MQWIAVYSMNQKFKVITKFKYYKSYLETQTGWQLKKLRVNGVKEYVNNKLAKLLLKSDILLEVTAAHSPAQNGIAEQINWTIVEHTRVILTHHNLPKEATAYTVYLKNRSPTRAIKEHVTPDKLFKQKTPDVSHLQEFGIKCWVLQQDGKQSKLIPKCESDAADEPTVGIKA